MKKKKKTVKKIMKPIVKEKVTKIIKPQEKIIPGSGLIKKFILF